MKILLIGCGAVSYVLSSLLNKDENVSLIVCASNDLDSAKEFIQSSRKIKIIKLDASKKEEIINAAKGFDLIINASLPDYNEIIMQATLEVKANYQDLCSYLEDLKTPEQLKYENEFKKNNLIALINTGIAPGITNILAKDIADKFDILDSIKIRLLEDQKAIEFIPSWSLKVTIDELNSQPLNFFENKFKLVIPFEDSEEYVFLEPYGKRIAVNIYGDEISTLPMYIKAKNIDFKCAGNDIDFARTICKLGLLNKNKISLDNQEIIPLNLFSKFAPKVPTPKEMQNLISKKIVENGIFISVVEGFGVQSSRNIKIKKTILYPDLLNIQKIMPGATYISYPTALAAYAFFKIFNKINNFGVFVPEALEKSVRKEIMLELENNNVVIIEEYTKNNEF
jgi:saccharopine dehydrogenase (NAD+, L-lysine forming)